MWVSASVRSGCGGVRGVCEGVQVGVRGCGCPPAWGVGVEVCVGCVRVCVGVCVGYTWVSVFWGVKDVGCVPAGVCLGGVCEEWGGCLCVGCAQGVYVCVSGVCEGVHGCFCGGVSVWGLLGVCV